MPRKLAITDKAVVSRIHYVRGQKIMLDTDLAELYGVPTKRLKEQVKRNKDIFPVHFMFELKEAEYQNLRSQIATSSWGGQRYRPYAFTEHGVLQLANVLKSRRARQMSVRIIEVFIKMREMLHVHKDLIIQIGQLEKQVEQHSGDIKTLFSSIKQLLDTPPPPRSKIGFRIRE